MYREKDTGGSRDTHGTHGTHGSTRAHGSHGRTSQPPTQTQRHSPARTTTRRPKPRPTQQPQEQPQGRSRPLPVADSEEAAPSEPDPASTRCLHPLPERLPAPARRPGRRNEGDRCVTASGAARAPDELKTREAETGMRNGRGEADLRAQRRDHEGPRVEHGAGAQVSARCH